MTQAILPLTGLLTGIGVLVMGSGLLGTLLAVRASLEGFSVEITGVVMSTYFVGLILGSTYAVRLIERAGHIRTFAGLASVASAVTLGFALTVSPLPWAALRAVMGFCLAGLYMVTESWLNEQTPRTARGRVLSIYMIVNLGALGSGQLLLPLGDPAKLELFCVSSILLSLGLVPVTMTRTVAPTPARISPVRMIGLYRLSPLGLACCFGSGLAMGAIWGMGPVYAQVSGLNLNGIAAFMVALVLGGLALQWPIGALSDRVDRRAVITASALGGSCVGVAALVLDTSSVTTVLLLACLLGGAAFPLYALGVAHVNDHTDGEDFVSVSGGLLLAYGCGAAIGPVAAAAVMGQLGSGGFFVYEALVCGAIGAFGLLRMRSRPSIPVEEQSATILVPRTSPISAGLDPRADPEAVVAEPLDPAHQDYAPAERSI